MVKTQQLLLAVVAAAVIGFFIGRLTGPQGGKPADFDATKPSGAAAAHAGGSPLKATAALDKAKPKAAKPAAGADDTIFKVPLGDSPARGPKDALVTAVVFTEFQCPYCARIAPSLERLLQKYPQDFRVVFKHNPLNFHQNARLAAEAALAAGSQGKFWEMHDLLFANQKALARTDLEGYASQLGLDLARFNKDLDEHVHQAAIDADLALGRRLAVRGTPHTFINGRRVAGAKPLPALEAIVQDALAEAQALVKAGTPRGEVYEKVTSMGQLFAKAPERPERSPRAQEDPKAIYRVPMPEGDAYARGAQDALVTVMEFSDFQCPYCRKAAATMDELLAAYPGKLRLVFRHNPLPMHPQAGPAAQAALAAAEQGKFWEMHDLLFANARQLDRKSLTRYAEQLGLDMGRFETFVDQEQGKARVGADQAIARSLGARGTPAFFINGRKLSGARPLDQFKAVVDEELARAEAELKRGTPRAQLYERLVASGATSLTTLQTPPSAKLGLPSAPVKLATGEAPTRGPDDAKVKVVIFSDFECPYCSRVVAPLEQLASEYPKRVQVAFKQNPLPFHKSATLAAEAALAAHDQGKFWEMHDRLFANQKALRRADLERYAGELGLDLKRFRDALDTHRFLPRIEADIAEAKAAGVRGTPSIFVNGSGLRGAVSYEQLKSAVEAALSGKTPDAGAGSLRGRLRSPLLRKLDLKKLGVRPPRPSAQ